MTLDLASGKVTVAGGLGAVTGDVIGIAVAVARDGRLRAPLESLPGYRATCVTLTEGHAGPSAPRPGRCARVVAFTPGGSVVSTPASLPGSRGRIPRLDRAGASQATITTYEARRFPPPVIADARRVAARLLICLGARLVVDDLARRASRSRPAPSCPSAGRSSYRLKASRASAFAAPRAASPCPRHRPAAGAAR